MGLRETKKQQTRTAIADAALELFLEHGFAQVTVADVARRAGVSTNTVFNYFSTKEDLFFDRQAEAEGHLAALVRDRAPGTCPVEVVRDSLLAALQRNEPMLGLHPGAVRFWQVIHDSPALRAREREIGERAEAALAVALAEHAPTTAMTSSSSDLPMPAFLAGAVAGTHRAVLREIQRRVMSGEPAAHARDAVAPAALRAFNLLCLGLHADAREETPQRRRSPRQPGP
ncbi:MULTISPECIES: TetR/AcrR family transcriptional regulator [Streptomyces]|uniref:Helix-turn-helix domain containing protein n=1 Tax=Streptomyces mirabilis TaxID=68239 RepID=A0ABU3V782_9ACTN|nr:MULTISPECIES: TetR/AcrR family transcriptional regulator [Streptomyces]MCX4617608.1 TetR/AcrR family transcriptional regulator [Streptomyces mirabilis]MCX5356916.1 TetR/AcrR family transcriptional regulator [Streptomyces mirabilis]MDU9002031.1 helix-turn-helix domain containing protein [Streptomyces mirabilis]